MSPKSTIVFERQPSCDIFNNQHNTAAQYRTPNCGLELLLFPQSVVLSESEDEVRKVDSRAWLLLGCA
ncbi:hypothetical protein CCR75_007955 [Bremia lactucae]|uniref:Uncharacterized protein n=1 Tax=Bremia lactucae TaxID=4779 RepID=A0A976FLM0_BRELC|nr:hypothetical protein CCR75_007955 [Bremia lactucae]